MLASSTDYLDGYLARKWKIVSSFGKFTDPIADKILIIGVLSVFTYKTIIPLIFTAIIVFREVLLTVIRIILLSRKKVLSSNSSGKIKTFSQIIAIVAIYILIIFKDHIQSFLGQKFIDYSIIVLMTWLVIITTYSGVQFFRDNKRLISKIL
jgi:CDP-diacylglycerol--glycerol-3-phosphate 3-phosphatidyltransferase